jgi:hypothetical protein
MVTVSKVETALVFFKLLTQKTKIQIMQPELPSPNTPATTPKPIQQYAENNCRY